MPDIKLGSLFDGIGVFPLAASRCGIRPVWASEIEKAPISITKRHFPDMAHLGDITKVDGGKIEIDSISTKAAFNGTKLLNGHFSGKQLQVGAVKGENMARNHKSYGA